jgi:UDP-glucose 4-epimerase
MTLVWIVGSGGLLGSALCRALGGSASDSLFSTERFKWTNESVVDTQMKLAIDAFADRAVEASRWEIYWAAGVGNMSSSETDLARETRMLSTFLGYVASDDRLRKTPGSVAFASSAGAIYAGSQDYIISEKSLAAATTPYGREKLKQEHMLNRFALDTATPVLFARLSTIYGPGQSTGKQQGLLAHIARSMLRNRPITIFVSFDTIRDYIFSDDAARMVVNALRASRRDAPVVIKIIASEQPVTIAEIISTFRKVERRPPRIVTNASSLSGMYSRCIRFHSVAIPETRSAAKTTLRVGIAKLLAAERLAFVRGSRARENDRLH